MLLVLQMTVQLGGLISFQVQRMELLVFVPLFPYQGGSKRVFAVPKFSNEDSFAVCTGACVAQNVSSIANFEEETGSRCARSLHLTFQFLEHGASGGACGGHPLHLRVLCSWR